MWGIKVKIYNRHTMEDKSYKIDTCYVYEENLQKKLKYFKDNPWFYEVLDYYRVR